MYDPVASYLAVILIWMFAVWCVITYLGREHDAFRRIGIPQDWLEWFDDRTPLAVGVSLGLPMFALLLRLYIQFWRYS